MTRRGESKDGALSCRSSAEYDELLRVTELMPPRERRAWASTRALQLADCERRRCPTLGVLRRAA